MKVRKITQSLQFRRVFTNPRFHMGRVLKRGAILAGASSLFLGWFPGIIPSLGLSSLIEIVRGRKIINVIR